MGLVKFMNYIVSVLAIILMYGYALADEPNPGDAKILAVVPVKSGKVDQSVYRQFDRLVPELKKISRNSMIKLECRYSGRVDRERDVENAYKLAAHIEKYLRVRHKLDLDLWVAINITPKSAKSSPVLTMAVFSDGIKKYDAVLVEPAKNHQQ